VLDTQLRVQIDVIKQLGSRIEKQLNEQEKNLPTLSRTEAAKNRAGLVKLRRDYQHVQSRFKNLCLTTKQKKEFAIAQQREKTEQVESRNAESESLKLQIQQQIEQDKVAEQIMKERHEEIIQINQGMRQVNDIYKDLANIVGSQQEDIDQIDNQMEESKEHAAAGLKQVEEANIKADQNCVIS